MSVPEPPPGAGELSPPGGACSGCRSTALIVRLAAPAAIAGVGALGCTAIWFGDPTTPGGPLPVCPLKVLTGLDCPGCGGLRMMYSLMHGDLLAALHYNAVALAAVVFLGVCYVSWVRGRWQGRAVWNPLWLRKWTPTVALVVLVLWSVIRNIPVPPFTGLWV